MRSNLNIDWSLGNFGVNWGMRYYSGLKEECSYDRTGGAECNNPDFSSAYTLAIPVRNTGSNTFHDLQVRYNTPGTPPSRQVPTTCSTTRARSCTASRTRASYYGGFDIGRFYYMKYTQRF